MTKVESRRVHGFALRLLRVRKRITQANLAKILSDIRNADIDQGLISRVESGVKPVGGLLDDWLKGLGYSSADFTNAVRESSNSSFETITEQFFKPNPREALHRLVETQEIYAVCRSRRSKVLSDLKARILSNNIQRGAALRLGSLARHYEVIEEIVLDVLESLHMEGLVERRDGEFFVPTSSENCLIRQTVLLRIRFEFEGAMSLALRDDISRENRLIQLRSYISEMRSHAIKKNDYLEIASFQIADLDFHRAIVNCSQQKSAMPGRIIMQAFYAVGLAGTTDEKLARQSAVIQEHEEILARIEAFNSQNRTECLKSLSNAYIQHFLHGSYGRADLAKDEIVQEIVKIQKQFEVTDESHIVSPSKL